MKPTPRHVLALWKQDPGLEATPSEVRKALDADKAQTARVRDILADLEHEGALERVNRRYRLPRPRRAPREAAQAAEPTPVGVFSAHPNGFGFVDLEGGRESVFIPPRYVAGALDGDWVRVRHVRPKRARPFGRITDVLRRKRSRMRGHLVREDGETWVAPFNEKLPMVFVEAEKAREDLPDDTHVEVELTHFPEHADEAPEGHIVQVLDSEESPEQVVLNILADTTLSPHFSAATEREMKRTSRTVDASADGRREDLRALDFVTIDGADARDFDDAVCLERADGGNWRLLVSIADVAAYVKPGTAVDLDAYEKGTSVYFPRQVFPMLPELLSNNLCSLKPKVPRLALTCEMELRPDGERVRQRVYESVIESKARLTYGQVQGYFESRRRKGMPARIADMLERMRELAATLRHKRSRRGALDFMFPEYRFDLDRQGFPREIYAVYPTEATRLIEQFMLEANETVAHHCHEHELPILYRVHDPPPADQIPPLAVTLVNFGVKVRESELRQSQGLKKVLSRIADNPRREQIEVAILKTMSQAQYRASNDGHFALAAPHYTHFTSPIRRYPDLLVHRALKAWLADRKPTPLPPHAGLHLSTAERNAGDAEQKVIRLYKVLFMEPHLGEAFPANVTSVSDRGVFLRLRDHPVDGPVDIAELPGFWRFDRRRNVLAGKGRRTIGLGERLTVALARTDRLTQSLDFAFVAWGWSDESHETPQEAAPPRRRRAGR